MIKSIEIDDIVSQHMNIIVEEIWDVMNARPANANSISINKKVITESVLDKITDEIEILTYTRETYSLIMRVTSLVGKQYFDGYTRDIDSAVQIRINEILKI